MRLLSNHLRRNPEGRADHGDALTIAEVGAKTKIDYEKRDGEHDDTHSEQERAAH